ncbi:hypothetical protein TIFTF001_031429 [Ficus carica]|uniref:Cellulose synthase-like protein E1 n=1 Tax=Ficus carica TaxID=3494 RepID=A0AA88DV98_FICCA|nr:hypothetical protein TIFTF001_031429 [Ficus carica]
MGDGFGLVCLELSCGSVFTGFSLKPFGGTGFIDAPSRTGSLRGPYSTMHEKKLPGVDIFVCTADPTIEPPIMVINTVLSVMAYDYPQHKLSVYLSDDGGSDLTFFALLEASKFAKHWIPYCKKFDVEPRSPAAYFRSLTPDQEDANLAKDLAIIKACFSHFKINYTRTWRTALKTLPSSAESQMKKGQNIKDSLNGTQILLAVTMTPLFKYASILLDGRDPKSTDVAGCTLPTLVYLAREKRPHHFHNFKAGAMNALIRVSSKISNGQIILNVDCDMYSNNSKSIRDTLCFLLDEEKGDDIAYVQFPQNFENVTKNEIYGASLRVINEVEFHGLDGYGGPLYIGSGCFHRRDILSGRKFGEECKKEERREDGNKLKSIFELEETSKALASCTYEENTQWGNEIGLKYGCPVEDVVTGLSIQSQGWKSVYFNPARKAFLGVAPNTLPQTLVQHKRWSEGDFQILLSKYSPAWYAYKKISLGLQLGYCTYCLWAPNCLAILYYLIVPSLYLLKGIPLFPQISSPWLVPFAYVIIAKYTYSLAEFLWSGGSVLGWWNEQRIWLYKRASAYLFAFIDTILNKLGFSNSAFIITAKVADEDVSQRYEKEIMEFGTSSPMFTVLAVLALLNLYCLSGVVMDAVVKKSVAQVCWTMFPQILLSAVLVTINLPLFQGLFLRKDKGKMPSSLAVKSAAFALFSFTFFTILH